MQPKYSIFFIIIAILAVGVIGFNFFVSKSVEPLLVTDSITSTTSDDEPVSVVETPTSTPSSSTSSSTVVDLGIPANEPVALLNKSGEVMVTGTALGTMFFEGTFPVRFEDSDSSIQAEGTAKAIEEWTTTTPVKFVAKLKLFNPIKNSIGTLFFSRDNPSGLADNDLVVQFPAFIYSK